MAITEQMLIGICDRFLDAADSGDYMGGVHILAEDLKVHVMWEPANREDLDHTHDRTHGQTITESEHVAFKRDVFSGKITVDKIADHLGITVVPNPEPTNAEKLKAIYNAWINDTDDDTRIWDWFDSNGVKAGD